MRSRLLKFDLHRYSHHGCGKELLMMFLEMQQNGIPPTPSTFSSILTGCSHGGLVDEALQCFNLMESKYGVPPSVEHHNCIVDLLGRANKLEEAEDFIANKMKEPNVVTWRTLLGACRVHGDVNRAKRVLEKIIQLQPNDASAYVMMANIHAASHELQAANKIREEMVGKKIKKEPGISTIEIGTTLHSFYVNDTKHPATKDIYAEIEKMKAEAQTVGFKPSTCYVLHDVDEEMKRDLLWYHSEKLAIAYGLLQTPIGTPIIIHKNLRVCGDCHEATKVIAKVRQRNIFVRDSNRWHHFDENGHCSCSDYF